MSYRHLTYAEISTLEAQACTAEEWSRVMVAEGFLADNIYNVPGVPRFPYQLNEMPCECPPVSVNDNICFIINFKHMAPC